LIFDAVGERVECNEGEIGSRGATMAKPQKERQSYYGNGITKCSVSMQTELYHTVSLGLVKRYHENWKVFFLTHSR